MKQKAVALRSAMPNGSVGSWMTATRGKTSGFDYMRFILASLVILGHSRVVTYGLAAVGPAASGPAGHPPLFQPILWSIVPAFFVVSGFLIAGSLVRVNSAFEFGMLRALRIVPALFMETVIAAFIVGPMVTDLPLRDYFTAAALWVYPLNVIGDMHYVLPGVFTHNPAPNIVNVQLWTIPIELMCYATLLVLFIAVTLISRRWLLTLKKAAGLLTLGTVLVLLASMVLPPHEFPRSFHQGAATVTYPTFLLSFLLGVSAYFFQERIPLRFGLLLVALVATFLGMYGGTWQYFGVVPLAYATIYCGMTNFHKIRFIESGDYSYGIYLYGYPVQQTFAYLFPHNQIWELNFAVSWAVSLTLAVLSWHFVESRVLANRKPIIAAVRNFARSPVLNWR